MGITVHEVELIILIEGSKQQRDSSFHETQEAWLVNILGFLWLQDFSLGALDLLFIPPVPLHCSRNASYLEVFGRGLCGCFRLASWDCLRIEHHVPGFFFLLSLRPFILKLVSSCKYTPNVTSNNSGLLDQTKRTRIGFT